MKTVIKRYSCHALSFLIPIVVCVIVCMATGVYPFGENCILHMDMYHQYCPFFLEFIDKLQQGDTLLMTFRQGLGSDFIALYAYYLSSPWNLLLILCPKSFVIEFMTIVTFIKLGCCGISFYIFLGRHYKEEQVTLRVMLTRCLFAAAYAMSGFVVAYSWDLMWLDGVLLTPLIILGLELLVHENKVVCYYVTLALAIWANYYIAIMICIFLVLLFVPIFLRCKGSRGLAFLRFAWYSLLAGATSAVLLLPEIVVLGYSGNAAGGFPKEFTMYFNPVYELTRCFTIAGPYTGDDHWPNLYSGVFCLFLVTLFFFNKKIDWKTKVTAAFFVALFLFSFANNMADFVWHGFHFPTSLPGRQSFLFTFVMLWMGYHTVSHFKGVRIWHITVALALWVAEFVGIFLLEKPEIVLTESLILTGIFLLIYVILTVLLKITGAKSRQIFAYIALFIALGEVCSNMAVDGLYITSRTSYVAKRESYKELIAAAKKDEVFVRMEDPERTTKNDGAFYGYNSVTEFSSLMNQDVSHVYQLFYLEGGKNYYCYNGTTPLTSAMLSVKYLLMDSNQEENEFRHLVASCGDAYLYENTYCLPIGFVMPEAAENLALEMSQKASNLNALATACGATSKLICSVRPETEVTPGSTTITVDADGFYYAAYLTCSADTLTLHAPNERTRTFGKTTHRYLLELGELKAGESVVLENAKGEEIKYNVYQLNPYAVAEAMEQLTKQPFTLTEYKGNLLRGRITMEEEGHLVFSIPAEAGWSIYVDGKKTDMLPWQEGLLGVMVPKGEHEITLRYETPMLRVGAGISIGAVAAFVATLLIRKKMRKYK